MQLQIGLSKAAESVAVFAVSGAVPLQFNFTWSPWPDSTGRLNLAAQDPRNCSESWLVQEQHAAYIRLTEGSGQASQADEHALK